MDNIWIRDHIGQHVFFHGHFDVPVVLEDARLLGSDDSAGYECRVRLPNGSLEKNDSKLAALKKCLGEAQFHTLADGRGKLLLFTEHRDTLGYVRDHLEQWGFATCEIHGGMNPHERKRAQEVFRTGAQVCCATEAAGEGINLQICYLMINYDMPWNPTRLEQRLCRIHRIGQDRDCYAFNFVATDSEDGQPIVEGRILHRLLTKLDQMNEALEGRVLDVIGEVLSLNDINLPDMLRDAAYDPRRLDEYLWPRPTGSTWSGTP